MKIFRVLDPGGRYGSSREERRSICTLRDGGAKRYESNWIRRHTPTALRLATRTRAEGRRGIQFCTTIGPSTPPSAVTRWQQTSSKRTNGRRTGRVGGLRSRGSGYSPDCRLWVVGSGMWRHPAGMQVRCQQPVWPTNKQTSGPDIGWSEGKYIRLQVNGDGDTDGWGQCRS